MIYFIEKESVWNAVMVIGQVMSGFDVLSCDWKMHVSSYSLTEKVTFQLISEHEVSNKKILNCIMTWLVCHFN